LPRPHCPEPLFRRMIDVSLYSSSKGHSGNIVSSQAGLWPRRVRCHRAEGFGLWLSNAMSLLDLFARTLVNIPVLLLALLVAVKNFLASSTAIQRLDVGSTGSTPGTTFDTGIVVPHFASQQPFVGSPVCGPACLTLWISLVVQKPTA
jgi:hypothetical protein